MQFSELELRIFSAYRLPATQRVAPPKIFEAATTGIASYHLNHLKIADDGSRSF